MRSLEWYRFEYRLVLESCNILGYSKEEKAAAVETWLRKANEERGIRTTT